MLAVAGTTWLSAKSNGGMSSLMMACIEALSQEESGQTVEGRYSDCVEGGVEHGTFEKSGTLEIVGVSVTGKKGQVYVIVWERWACVEGGPKNTCDTAESGMRIISSSVQD